MYKRTITVITNVNQDFDAGGMTWRVDEEGDLMVVLENGRTYVIDYVKEPTWTVWQDYDTVDDFAVTITSDHVARAKELLEALGEGL